jgi:SAM-dependent methyltransferase
MAMNAGGILGKKEIKVLIFSPGASKDHILIRRNSSFAQCSITDLSNFQESEFFIPMDTKEKFDIVVACEVVEHFTKPRQEFSRLFSYLNKNGILIVSTNIRQDSRLGGSAYPFLAGHTSYYSGNSLIHLAAMNHLYIDFRTPTGTWLLSKSKRYIYFAKSKTTYYSIVNYYSRNSKPNSEYLDATSNSILTISDHTDSKNIRSIT